MTLRPDWQVVVVVYSHDLHRPNIATQRKTIVTTNVDSTNGPDARRLILEHMN
jgi:hypothetical protein